MVNQILDSQNIRQAYLDLALQFEEESKVSHYAGIDSVRLLDVDYKAKKILDEVAFELKNSLPVAPARLVKIPKKDGKTRDIYILSVKDRIRARAIFRIIEPLFEKAYSPYLFSYRTSHPSALAARSVARRYHRYFNQDYVMTIDLKSYSDHINLGILRKQLLGIGLTPEAIKLIEPFLKIRLWQEGELITWDKGIPQGMPLTALFANLYLTEVDKTLGHKVALYRRAGDDLIAFDKDKNKVEDVFLKAQKMAKDLGLVIQETKTHFAKNDEPFSYLGYVFKNNHLSLRASLVRALKINWRQQLEFKEGSLNQKITRLRYLCFLRENNFQRQFLEVFRQHQQVDDDEEIKKLSHQFYNYVAIFLLGKATPRNRRLAQKYLKEIKLPSFYETYLAYRRGKKELAT